MNDYKGTLTYASNTVSSGSLTTTELDYNMPVVSIPTPFVYPTPINNNKKGGDENMRYLYEVILVNPKNDELFTTKVVARSETSALMEAYSESQFSSVGKVSETLIAINVPFDDLKTSCRVLMEWKKKESLKKAIETIKKAVE